MIPSSFFISLLSLFLFIISIYGSFGQTLIKDTCNLITQQNPNIKPDFCITSLQASPAISHCSNLKGLGAISIILTQSNVTATRSYIRKMLKNSRLDPDIRGRLDDCFELYSNAIPKLKLAMKYYISKRYFVANVQISSVMDAATTCEDGFKEKKGLVSPLTERNKETSELSAMVLSIMHILLSGSNSS